MEPCLRFSPPVRRAAKSRRFPMKNSWISSRKKWKITCRRIGGFPEELLQQVMEPIAGMENPFHYRNKAQFPVGTDKDGHIITGFYAGRTHQIIPNRDCALGVPVNLEILDRVIGFMEKYHIPAYDERKRAKGWCVIF